ncbi:helix-turn-helix domain-containing protein [Lawsonibacter celer]|jgi:AraC-like DNA-binding protein|uniref:helix-turn-helix domain-containing protein n=1 Tax=Lawsonibacter celer TaxID=2986526 RepID=UPI001647600C|nr:AraC family transcriptional regulator [Lawsonibacter celer]
MTYIPEQENTVLWVAESSFQPHGGLKSHAHDYYQLFLVREGPQKYSVGDEERILEAGESVLAKPNVLHGMENMSDEVCRCYEVKFTISAPRLEALLTTLPPFFPKDDFVSGLVRELVAESTCARASTPAFVSDYLVAVINYLFRHYGEGAPVEGEDAGMVDTVGYSPLSREIIRYLEQNYSREVSLQEIAEAVGFNKNYICSVFKRDSGMTIGNCQTVIRIRKAAELISFSDMSLTQVASATGFTNLSHFSRIFKKVTRIPPGQYRRMFASNILSYGNPTDEATQKILQQNGFIVSVLGRKKMTIEDILQQLHRDAQEQE